jgi:hypothetical protein
MAPHRTVGFSLAGADNRNSPAAVAGLYGSFDLVGLTGAVGVQCDFGLPTVALSHRWQKELYVFRLRRCWSGNRWASPRTHKAASVAQAADPMMGCADAIHFRLGETVGRQWTSERP